MVPFLGLLGGWETDWHHRWFTSRFRMMYRTNFLLRLYFSLPFCRDEHKPESAGVCVCVCVWKWVWTWTCVRVCAADLSDHDVDYLIPFISIIFFYISCSCDLAFFYYYFARVSGFFFTNILPLFMLDTLYSNYFCFFFPPHTQNILNCCCVFFLNWSI